MNTNQLIPHVIYEGQPKKYGKRKDRNGETIREMHTPCDRCCPWDGYSRPADRGYCSAAFQATHRDHDGNPLSGENSLVHPSLGLAVWRCGNCGFDMYRAEKLNTQKKGQENERRNKNF
tara:strand:+ start:414 stop:770 length:357 start_codon:yes stop_codon:yes gene_type:complete